MAATSLLRKLLPPDEKIFFDLFQENISTAHEAAQLLVDVVTNGFTGYKVEKVRSLKFKSGDNLNKTLTHLSTTFITPIEREDIQTLSILINKITQKTVKVIKYAKVYNIDEFNTFIKDAANILVNVTIELQTAVNGLKKFNGPKAHTESSQRMRELESQCDFLLTDAIEDLFSGSHETLEVVKYRGLYRDVESVMETAHNISDLVLNIVLKHS
jgi:uncharacterized protein Yka (UPF0111/DUF47 family)